MFKNHRRGKLTIFLSIAILCLLVLVFAGAIYYTRWHKEDLNKRLPMTITVQPTDKSQELIAYRLLYAYMEPYRELNANPLERLSYIGYNKFQLLAGDSQAFAVGVTFQVQLADKQWSLHRNWGKVQANGMIKNIHWTLRIKKVGKRAYTLERIDTTSPSVAGLPPVKNQYQKQSGIPVPNEQDRYQIVSGELQVTYDGGKHWVSVPVDVNQLFAGDYSGPKDTLIDGSFVIKPSRTAFVVGDGTDLSILQSTDKGKHWQSTAVPSPFKGVRLRLLGFTSKQDGYLILTGDRTMSTEGNATLKTSDGGRTWQVVGGVNTGTLATGGGFIDSKLGFMSFGSTGQPAHPVLYRTTDGGKSWQRVQIQIPAAYQGVFTVAEVPTFDGSQGTLLVNQGPDGDYEGGKVMARFISLDKGATWKFANLVDPDNVLSHKP